jgi:hypothetical protein
LPKDDHLSSPDAHILAHDIREGMSDEKKIAEEDQISQEVISQEKEVVSEEKKSE